MTKLKDLRCGDKILIEATVTGRTIGEHSHVCRLPSNNEFCIHSDSDIHKVAAFALRVGDRVKWWAGSRCEYGEVLAIDPSAEGGPQVWLKQKDNWGRIRASGSTELERLKAENERMRKALEFYASPSNWINTPPWDGDPECISEKAIPVLPEEGRPCDCGDTARAALKGDTHGN